MGVIVGGVTSGAGAELEVEGRLARSAPMVIADDLDDALGRVCDVSDDGCCLSPVHTCVHVSLHR